MQTHMAERFTLAKMITEMLSNLAIRTGKGCLEVIPNKITDTMGIVADVNLLYLNAVVHKDYIACNPISISVYEDKIYIWNYSAV